jgi:hypothetical protein
MSPSPGLADPAQLAASDPLSAPDLLSPEGIHEYLLRAHTISNEIHFKFLQALRALDEGALFHALGFPTIRAYAEEFFGWEKTHTYEALQVARALDDLPLTRDRYLGGLAYTRVQQITRIATRETEAEWIAFAEKTTLKRLRIEVSDAKGKGRKKPRNDQYSLPAQRMRLPFDFSPDEFTVLMTALRKKAAELSQVLEREVTPKEALHQMATEILETDPASIAEGRVEREGAAHTILFRHCPGCRRSDVETDDGPMEIAPEVIARYEKTAEKLVIRPEEEALPGEAPVPEDVKPTSSEAPPSSPEARALPSIDHHNTRPFLEKLFLRDGRRCSNPLCRRPLPLQGNHMKRRSEGGETELHNENALCIPCHALHTAGLLDISGDPIDGLTFTPRGVKLARSLEREKVSVEAMPVVMVQVAPSAVPGGKPSPTESTTLVPEEASALEDATLGLIALGYRKADAGPRARRALEHLKQRGDRITAETLLKAALR